MDVVLMVQIKIKMVVANHMIQIHYLVIKRIMDVVQMKKRLVMKQVLIVILQIGHGHRCVPEHNTVVAQMEIVLVIEIDPIVLEVVHSVNMVVAQMVLLLAIKIDQIVKYLCAHLPNMDVAQMEIPEIKPELIVNLFFIHLVYD
jgi:hypothetical protein